MTAKRAVRTIDWTTNGEKVRRVVARKGGHRAADVPMCQHGIPMRRCDECGAFVASHPGAVVHVCGVEQASCGDERTGGAA